MSWRTVIGLLIFAISIAGSIWQIPATSDPPKMKAGGFRIGVYRFAIVIDHPARPGAYYTILPYDDLVIFDDETEQRLKAADSEEESPIPQPSGIIKEHLARWKSDLRFLLESKLHLEINDQTDLKTIYEVKVSNGQILIQRQIKNYTQREIKGIGRGLIFNPQDKIWLDHQHLKRPAGATEEKARITKQNISLVKIVNPGLSEALEIKTQPTDTVVIDFEYNLIMVRTLLPSLPQESIQDLQEIKIVPAI